MASSDLHMDSEMPSEENSVMEPTDWLDSYIQDLEFLPAVEDISTEKSNYGLDATPLSNTIQSTDIPSTTKSKTLNEWRLGYNVMANIVDYKNEIKVHLRKYVEKQDYLAPSTSGVTMSAATWGEFIHKFPLVNHKYREASFISNNALITCVDSNRLVLQQLYQSSDESYRLNSNYLELNIDQMNSLKDILMDITEMFLYYLLCEEIPKQLLHRKSQMNFLSTPTITCDEFISLILQCVFEDVCQHVRLLFPCQGCKIESPSQLNHDCLYTAPLEMFEAVEERALLSVNITDIVNNICEKAGLNLQIMDESTLSYYSVSDYKREIKKLYSQ